MRYSRARCGAWALPEEEMTGHGFRAAARTILDEILGVRPDLIEHQLAHAVRDPLGRAYNRTAHLPERRKMMQQWADYLGQIEGARRNHFDQSSQRLISLPISQRCAKSIVDTLGQY